MEHKPNNLLGEGDQDAGAEESDDDEEEESCDKDMVLIRLITAYERIGENVRIKLNKPIKSIGVYESVEKYIIELEHFKAFTSLRQMANGVFGGNSDVRKSIQQYHGNETLFILDRFLDSFYKSGTIEYERNRLRCVINGFDIESYELFR